MDNSFPRMLYKAPGPEAIHGGQFATCIVEHDEDMSAALADGWRTTTPEAKALADEAKLDQAIAPDAAPAADPVVEVAMPAPAPDPAPEVPADPAAPAAETGAEVELSDEDITKAEREQLKTRAMQLNLIYPRNATNAKLAELVAAAETGAASDEG